MITFAAGLVLRRGERTLEFERDLGDGRLQFAFGDTREIQTIKLTEIYSAVLEGTVSVVRPTAAPLSGPFIIWRPPEVRKRPARPAARPETLPGTAGHR